MSTTALTASATAFASKSQAPSALAYITQPDVTLDNLETDQAKKWLGVETDAKFSPAVAVKKIKGAIPKNIPFHDAARLMPILAAKYLVEQGLHEKINVAQAGDAPPDADSFYMKTVGHGKNYVSATILDARMFALLPSDLKTRIKCSAPLEPLRPLLLRDEAHRDLVFSALREFPKAITKAVSKCVTDEVRLQPDATPADVVEAVESGLRRKTRTGLVDALTALLKKLPPHWHKSRTAGAALKQAMAMEAQGLTQADEPSAKAQNSGAAPEGVQPQSESPASPSPDSDKAPAAVSSSSPEALPSLAAQSEPTDAVENSDKPHAEASADSVEEPAPAPIPDADTSLGANEGGVAPATANPSVTGTASAPSPDSDKAPAATFSSSPEALTSPAAQSEPTDTVENSDKPHAEASADSVEEPAPAPIPDADASLGANEGGVAPATANLSVTGTASAPANTEQGDLGLFTPSPTPPQPLRAPATTAESSAAALAKGDAGVENTGSEIITKRIKARFTDQKIEIEFHGRGPLPADLKKVLAKNIIGDLHTDGSRTFRREKNTPADWQALRSAILVLRAA